MVSCRKLFLKCFQDGLSQFGHDFIVGKTLLQQCSVAVFLLGVLCSDL